MGYMFKFIKFLLVVVIIGGLSYFFFMVPLGEKTFWEHIVGISETDEAKELEGELEKKVKDAAEDLSEEIKKKAADIAEAKGDLLLKGKDALKSAEDIASGKVEHSDGEKQELGELIQNAAQPDEEDKEALNQLINDKSSKTD